MWCILNYKLIAIDLDGTLLTGDNSISEQTKKIISKLKERGVKIVIATGRMFVSALPYVRELELNNPVITYNGALIKTLDNGKNDGKTLYHQPLPEKLAEEIIKECNKKELHLNLYLDDTLYVENNNKESRGYERSSGVKAYKVDSFLDFMNKPPTKLLAIDNNRESQQKHQKHFQKNYGSKLEISESKSNYIEFMAKGVSKGKALKYLADKWKFSSEEVIAIGDNWNDFPMLKWAGLGIAMDSAPESLKNRVDRIAPDNEEEGVAVVLKDIF